MAHRTATGANPASARSTGGGGSPAHSEDERATPWRPSLYLNDIRRLAYLKWMEAGRPAGDSSHFWLEAEQELLQGA